MFQTLLFLDSKTCADKIAIGQLQNSPKGVTRAFVLQPGDPDSAKGNGSTMNPGKVGSKHSPIEQQHTVVSEEPNKRPSTHHSTAGNGKGNIPGSIVSEEIKSGSSSTSAAGAGGHLSSTNDEHTDIPGYRSLYMYM